MDKDLDNYLITIKEHIEECVNNLDDFNKKLSNEKLNSKDYFAAERLLQVLIESGIGIAKQLAKFLNKSVRTSAYENFVLLNDMDVISKEELAEWQSMIGLRNVLVHEYLKVDRAVINAVIEKKLYKNTGIFCEKMLEHFLKN